MKFQVGKKSLSNLIGVHPMLAAAAVMTIENELFRHDATIFEGVRNKKRQRYLVTKGVSKTMMSRHLTGCAVDIVPYIEGAPRWDGLRSNGVLDEELQRKVDEAFEDIHKGMLNSAKVLNLSVVNLFDLVGWDKPHWQIDSYYDVRTLNHKLP